VSFLNLYNNNISDTGACAIAVALRVNSVLGTLSLANNFVTSDSAIAFSKSLTRYELSVADMADRKKAEEVSE
jgi:hypothetical protein